MFKNKKLNSTGFQESDQQLPIGESTDASVDLRRIVDKYALTVRDGNLALMHVDRTYRPSSPDGEDVLFRYGRKSPRRQFFILLPDGSIDHTVVDEKKGVYERRWTVAGEADSSGRPIVHGMGKQEDFRGYTRNDIVGIHVPQDAIAKEFRDVSLDPVTQKDMARLTPELTNARGLDLLKGTGLYDEFRFVGTMVLLEETSKYSSESRSAVSEDVARLAGSAAL